MRIGFVGTGVISSAVVTALMTRATRPERVVVSPRNATRANTLAQRYPQVVIGRDNQDVVDKSDVICLGVRPQDAHSALGSLRFQPTQTVVSFISTFSTKDLADLVQPASEIFRAVPLPPITKHLGPIAVFPGGAIITELFDELGSVVAVASEAELQTLWSVTSMMASYFRFQASATGWLESQHVAPDRARLFVASMFQALADTGMQEVGTGFGQLAIEHATPGGLNEQLMRELEAMNCFQTLEDGLALILRRMRGEASFEDKLGPHD